MSLDINTGYNNAFKTFVDFAEQSHKRGLDAATAKTTLSNRTITVASAHLYGGEGIFTSSGERAVNNTTRAMFKAAIIDMFSGEDNIPPAVKDAMKLADYGKGKPLTARRILAVKTAIDGNNATLLNRATSQAAAKDQFHFAEPEVAEKALELGFSKGELPNLARAASLYAQASGKSEMEAMREVATPGSKANRLMNYGGCFLKSAENFKAGLRQLDAFAEWFADVQSFVNDNGHSRNRTGADTSTKVNISYDITADDTTVNGLEMVIFRDIADNPAADLQTANPEELFGMKNNAAMRFYGRNMHESMLGTVFNLPSDKRNVLFAVTDMFLPLYESQADIRNKENRETPELMGGNNRIFAARVLNHIDEIAALMDKGRLSTKDVIKICFPDIGRTGGNNLKTLNDWFAGIGRELDAAGLTEENEQTRADRLAVLERMSTTGCTLKEAIKSLRGGAMPPMGAYQVGYSMQLHEFPSGGLDQMKADLKRVDNYGTIGPDGKADEKNLQIPAEECNHNITFPNGTVLKCGAKAALKGNIDKCVENVRKLCGEAHALQAEIVGACLSQSANGPLKGGLANYGLYASEHAALDYSLSRDDETGAVTIRYESPSRLPVRFSWTCTVNVDGSCVTTPFTVNADMRPVEIDSAKARKMVSESVRSLGLAGQFDAEDIEAAEEMLQKHGNGLPGMTARVLSNYIVRTVAKGGSEESVERIANDMKKWRMFGFGDQRLAKVGECFVRRQNEFVKAMTSDKNEFQSDRPEVFKGFYADADRNTWKINGKQVNNLNNADAVVDKLFSVVKDPMKRKVITTLLNQNLVADLFSLMDRRPVQSYADGAAGDQLEFLYTTEGSDQFVSKGFMEDEDPTNTIVTGNWDLVVALDVSEDGKTATLSFSQVKAITQDGSADEDRLLGQVELTQKSTLDLTKEIPEVTDVTFSQVFTADKVPSENQEVAAPANQPPTIIYA